MSRNRRRRLTTFKGVRKKMRKWWIVYKKNKKLKKS